MSTRLLFVYAADSGAVQALIHVVHKIVSPSTYPCSLCALTYGPLGQRAAWKRALADLGVDSEFLHRDELHQRYGADHAALPAVFRIVDGRPAPLIAKPELDACRDLDALIALVEARLETISGASAPLR